MGGGERAIGWNGGVAAELLGISLGVVIILIVFAAYIPSIRNYKQIMPNIYRENFSPEIIMAIFKILVEYVDSYDYLSFDKDYESMKSF